MKKKIIVILLTNLALLSLSCNFLDTFNHLISNLIESVNVATPLPPTSTQVTLPAETPNEETQLLPENTPIPESQSSNEFRILYGGRDGVWISHSDGRNLTQIYEGLFLNDLRSAVAPDGSSLALVIRTEQGYDLIVIDLFSGEQVRVAQLLEGFSTGQPDDPKTFVEEALRRHNSIAWQSEHGRLLAFVGAINSPTTDLYVYDTQTRQIKQLMSDPSQAIRPTWSPDGQYILYYGVSWVGPFGGALLDYDRIDGVWGVHPENGEVIELPKPQNTLVDFVGWHDREDYLSCDNGLLTTIQISTGRQTEIMRCCCYSDISYSPVIGALILNLNTGCNEEIDEGIYYLGSPSAKPSKIYEKTAWELVWLPESQSWFAYPEGIILPYGASTLIFEPPLYDSSYLPAVSTNATEAWLVYEDHQPVVKVRVPFEDWQTILHESVDVLIWDPQDAGRLLIVLEDGRLMTAQYPNFVPEVVGNFDGSVSEAIYIP